MRIKWELLNGIAETNVQDLHNPSIHYTATPVCIPDKETLLVLLASLPCDKFLCKNVE